MNMNCKMKQIKIVIKINNLSYIYYRTANIKKHHNTHVLVADKREQNDFKAYLAALNSLHDAAHAVTEKGKGNRISPRRMASGPTFLGPPRPLIC
jgi:hypothetical protein